MGYLGFAVFLLMMLTLFRQSQKAKRFLIEQRDYPAYFKILMIECALVGYMTAASFINQFRSQILYWMILFLALGIKIYYLQPRAQLEQAGLKSVNSEGTTVG